MNGDGNDRGRGLLSHGSQEVLLRLLVASGRQRISSAVLNGRRVWIKRYDVESEPLAKRLHEIVSPLLPKSLRASRPADAEEMVARELRKMKAFEAAGFGVPSLVHQGGAVMVLSHVAEIVEDKLRRLRSADPTAHDRLLVKAAAALGRAHRAGLCHGRPHPRDMFVTGKDWGFVDFEEEPEAVMPFEVAQGRDVLLLFLQISSQAQVDGTEKEALSAYVEAGSASGVAALRSVLRFFLPLLPLLSLLEKVSLGSDGRRLLKAMRFLKCALKEKGAVDFTARKLARKQVRLGTAEGVKEEP